MKVFKFFIFVLTFATAIVSCSKEDEATPDFVAPVITLLDSSVVNVLQGTIYTDAGATASDSVDGDISDLIVVVNQVNTNVAGPYIVSYNVSDIAGNAAIEVTRTVNVIPPDETAPVITLLGSSFISVKQGDAFYDAGATALDDVDGEITASIIVVNQVNTDVLGSYVVTYNVSDAAGNTAKEVVRTVEVVKSVSGKKYESTYLKMVSIGQTVLNWEFKNKEELIAAGQYQVIEFKSGGDFFSEDVKSGTWTENGLIVTVKEGNELTELKVNGDILVIYESETQGESSYTFEMHFTKM